MSRQLLIEAVAKAVVYEEFGVGPDGAPVLLAVRPRAITPEELIREVDRLAPSLRSLPWGSPFEQEVFAVAIEFGESMAAILRVLSAAIDAARDRGQT